MKLIINSPINIQTGKPTGKPWKAGMQTNQSNNTSSQEKQEMTQQTIKPMAALGFDELRINRAPSRTKDGKVAPMAALGFAHNELGQQALWGRIQGQLDVLQLDEHDFVMLKEVYDDHIVYEVGNKLYKRGYTLDDNDQVTLANDVVEVVEQVSFDEIKTHDIHTQAVSNVEPMPALGFAHNK